jgi:hypothetical protein
MSLKEKGFCRVFEEAAYPASGWISCGFKPGCNYMVSELSGCLLLMVDEKKCEE